MKTAPALRRIDEVPEWWTDRFFDRQRLIRTRLLAGLEPAGEPMMLLQLQQYLTDYSTLEVSYAITTLSALGRRRGA